MRRLSLFGLIFGLLVGLPVVAQASVVAKIDKSTQTMQVFVNGVQRHTWKVSTGRRGYNTPVGQWRPKYLVRMHYSRKYDNSPMPYSIFYKGGYAIHGTGAVKRLGRRASHGCVRLHTKNAKALYWLVRKHGKSGTRIVVTNSSGSRKFAKTPDKRKVVRGKAAKKKIVAVKSTRPNHRVRVILTSSSSRKNHITEARVNLKRPLL